MPFHKKLLESLFRPRIGTKIANTQRNRQKDIAEAQRLLTENSEVNRRDLVDRLVAQRRGGSFRGIPESALDPILQNAAATRRRRRAR